jgi:hypothetical protein
MNELPMAHDTARRAALMVHAMAEPDQAWVLQSLPAGQQETLQGLLHELRELAIPSEAQLLREVLEREAPPAQRPTDAGVEPWVRGLAALDRSQVMALASTLGAEPPQLIAALLASGGWRWKGELLEQLGSPMARRVQAIEVSSTASSLKQAVGQAVWRRVAEAPEPGPARVSAWARLRSFGQRLAIRSRA